MNTATILIIDDDRSMRRLLRTLLIGHGFAVAEATSAQDGLRAATTEPPWLVILDLDLHLASDDRLTPLKALRAQIGVPVIVMSTCHEEVDKIAALDCGADDYVTTPFGAGEFLARIRVALRHARGAAPESPPILEVGPIRIDRARHRVTIDGEHVHLTPIELSILTALASPADRVLTHRQLAQQVWGPMATNKTHTLHVHMAALRRKLERDPARPRWLVTEARIGYRLRGDHAS